MKSPTVLIILIVVFAALVLLGFNKLLFLDITKRGWRRAERELPRLAPKLGLEFIEGKLDYEIGEMRGTYLGRHVEVRPDDKANIEVALLDRFKIEMGTYRSQLRRPPEGMVDFESGNKGFDGFFRKRFASPEVAHRLTRSTEPLNYIDEFRHKWNRKLRFLEVSERNVRCSMKYGLGTYIPARVLEALLPDLCRLAEILETAMGVNTASGSLEHEGRRDSHRK